MFKAVVIMFLLLFTVPVYAHGPERQVHRCGWVSLDAIDTTRQQCLKERYFGLAMQSFVLAKNYNISSVSNISDRDVGIIIANAYKIAEAMLEKRNAELLKTLKNLNN